MAADRELDRLCSWTGASLFTLAMTWLGLSAWDAHGGPAKTALQLSGGDFFSMQSWGHMLAHADIAHALSNAAGLAGLVTLWPQLLRHPSLLLILAFSYGAASPLAAQGLVYGASGWLHAVFCYCALAWSFQGRWVNHCRVSLLCGVAYKINLEATSINSVEVIAWQLHIAGALIGTVFAAAMMAFTQQAIQSANGASEAD